MSPRSLASLSLLLSALALPALAAAQTTPESPAPRIALTRDGEWLAFVLPPGKEPAPGADHGIGLDVFAPGLAAVLAAPAGAGALSASATRQVVIQPLAAQPGVAPWCAGVGGYLSGSTECLASDDASGPQPRLARQRVHVEWRDGGFSLSLSGGESGWRAPYLARAATAPAIALRPVPDSTDAATRWVLLGAQSARDLSLGAGWTMPWLGTVDIEAALAQIALVEADVLDPGLRESSLRVALSRGRFSGGFTGRVVRPEIAGRMGWSSLDLGVAWRTPWHGELSFGAENLLSARDSDGAAESDPRFDNVTARTPYVRYTQDF